jgi:hypothetical protein
MHQVERDTIKKFISDCLQAGNRTKPKSSVTILNYQGSVAQLSEIVKECTGELVAQHLNGKGQKDTLVQLMDASVSVSLLKAVRATKNASRVSIYEFTVHGMPGGHRNIIECYRHDGLKPQGGADKNMEQAASVRKVDTTQRPIVSTNNPSKPPASPSPSPVHSNHPVASHSPSPVHSNHPVASPSPSPVHKGYDHNDSAGESIHKDDKRVIAKKGEKLTNNLKPPSEDTFEWGDRKKDTVRKFVRDCLVGKDGEHRDEKSINIIISSADKLDILKAMSSEIATYKSQLAAAQKKYRVGYDTYHTGVRTTTFDVVREVGVIDGEKLHGELSFYALYIAVVGTFEIEVKGKDLFMDQRLGMPSVVWYKIRFFQRTTNPKDHIETGFQRYFSDPPKKYLDDDGDSNDPTLMRVYDYDTGELIEPKDTGSGPSVHDHLPKKKVQKKKVLRTRPGEDSEHESDEDDDGGVSDGEEYKPTKRSKQRRTKSAFSVDHLCLICGKMCI